MAVTPLPASTDQVTTGGTSVTVFPGNIAGGYITNPPTAPGYLMINPIDAASLTIGGNTFALAPGQTWSVISGQTTPTTANSASNNHVFSAVYWI